MKLSKSQKKIARELIQLGLHRECKSFTNEIARFTNSIIACMPDKNNPIKFAEQEHKNHLLWIQ